MTPSLHRPGLPLGLLLAALGVAGCAGAHYADEASMAAPQDYDESPKLMARAMMSDAAESGEAPSPEAPADPGAATPEPTPRQVIYRGALELQVRERMEALDGATALAKELGGFIEQAQGEMVIVRVPHARFETAMERLATLGKLLHRSVEAQDVTEQLTDMESRRQVLVSTRDRLLVLLEQAKDVKERLAILRELDRVTGELERMEAALRALRQLVEYATITLLLRTETPDLPPAEERSPFGWIRDLSYFERTLEGDAGDVELEVPPGFVRFEDADTWMAETADHALLRVGHVENDPVGDEAFWREALGFEMRARGLHALDDAQEADRLAVWAQTDDGFRYLLSVRVDGDRVLLVEALFPSAESYARHRDAVFAAVKGLP